MRDDAGVTLVFSFDGLERSVQTRLVVDGETIDVVSHENAEQLRIDAYTRELVATFVQSGMRTELRVTLLPRIRCTWSALEV